MRWSHGVMAGMRGQRGTRVYPWRAGLGGLAGLGELVLRLGWSLCLWSWLAGPGWAGLGWLGVGVGVAWHGHGHGHDASGMEAGEVVRGVSEVGAVVVEVGEVLWHGCWRGEGVLCPVLGLGAALDW